MKRVFALFVAFSVISSLNLLPPQVGAQPIPVPQTGPYTWDENTVLLEHFDGTTSGSTYGVVSYTNGMFGQAVHLVLHEWITWEYISPFGDTHLPEGTVEFWGKLDTLNYDGREPGFVRADTGPGFTVDTFYTVIRSNYPCSAYDTGECVSPPNPKWVIGTASGPVIAGVWHHYATTWGTEGFHFYVDGLLVYSSTNRAPQASCTTLWSVGGPVAGPPTSGIGFIGAVDELRISKIQRTFTTNTNATLTIQTAAVRLYWFAAAGVTYQVQWSPDFQNWFNLISVVGTGARTNVLDSTENGLHKFYRLVY